MGGSTDKQFHRPPKVTGIVLLVVIHQIKPAVVLVSLCENIWEIKPATCTESTQALWEAGLQAPENTATETRVLSEHWFRGAAGCSWVTIETLIRYLLKWVMRTQYQYLLCHLFNLCISYVCFIVFYNSNVSFLTIHASNHCPRLALLKWPQSAAPTIRLGILG